MRFRISTSALFALALVTGSSAAFAQLNTGGGTPGSAGVIGSPAAPPQDFRSTGISSAPGSVSTSATGIGAGSTSGTSMTPGSIGTMRGGPSGLPGDNPAAPGFPGKVGR